MSGSLQFRRNPIEWLRTPAQNRNSGPFPGKRQCYGSSNPASPAGNDGHLVL
jgi:hypothetical protein